MDDPVNCLVPENLPSHIEGASDGPLSGRTFVAKDLFNVAGHRTSNGSPDFHNHAVPSPSNAAVIDKLLSAGATLLGMTICDEFFYSLTGANAHYGTPVNQRAPGRLPGGSSSGSAAALTANMADFALGSDTGGSVRIPASFCGLWGIRPTLGRVSLDGGRAMAPSFDTAGWFTNDAALLSLVGSIVLEGDANRDEITRLIIADDILARTDTSVAEAFNTWIRGADLEITETVTMSDEGLDTWWNVFRVIQAGEVKTTNLPWVRDHQANLGPGISERFKMAEGISDEELAAARGAQSNIVRKINAVVTPGTILVMPTAPCIAPRIDAEESSLESFRSNTMALTCIAGLAGLPQVSMPMLTVEGCPAGVSLVGARGSDEQILELALRVTDAG